MSTTRRRRPRGFNLIELLLALLVFTTAFLMVLAVFPTSVKAIHQSRTIMLGNFIAQQQMEATLSESFSSLASSNGSYSVVSVVNGSTDVISYTYQVSVSSISSNRKDVRCQVSWDDQGTVRYVNLESEKANL